MDTWAMVEPGDAERNSEPVPSRLGIDPIAYAWRACNPRVPLPAVLRRSGGVTHRAMAAAAIISRLSLP